MNSIEWFIEQLEEHLLSQDIVLQLKNTEAFEQAKLLHKQEIIDAYDLGSLSDMQYPNPKTVIKNGEQYYQETFVSKGSDDTKEESKQETLEEVAERLYGLADKYSKNRIGFIEGAKWQEEHSKSLSDRWKEYQDWLNEPPEISDEKIALQAYKYEQYEFYGAGTAFEQGAKWYREQLKQRQ